MSTGLGLNLALSRYTSLLSLLSEYKKIDLGTQDQNHKHNMVAISFSHCNESDGINIQKVHELCPDFAYLLSPVPKKVYIFLILIISEHFERHSRYKTLSSLNIYTTSQS